MEQNIFRVRYLFDGSGPVLKRELNMAGNQGGSHEQHVKAGEQSHKSAGSGSSSQKAGEQSHKSSGSGSSSQGGTHEQHVKAGEQSQKNK